MQTQNALIVDDDRAILESYRSVLSHEINATHLAVASLAESLFSESPSTQTPDLLLNVTTASQGLEAVGIVRENLQTGIRFSCAIIDMRMPPGIDGLETANQILSLDPEIEIVFITAYSDIPLEVVRKQLGRERIEFLQKPIEVDTLLDKVTQLVQLRQQDSLNL